MNVEGSCHCGKITYRAVVDPARVGICHCTDCQVLTGTAYRVSVPVAVDAFTLLSGRPTHYVKTADSGNKRVQAFCGDCGSPIYSCAADAPTTYALRIGGLRQRADLPPVRQIWCDSSLAWATDLRVLPRRARE